MREAAAGIRDTKEAGKRKKRYETAKRNLDSDVCGDNAGDADGAVCESARPAGKDDPRSAGNYGGLRPFLESSAGRARVQNAVSQLVGKHHFLQDIRQIAVDCNIFFPSVNQKKALAAALKQSHRLPRYKDLHLLCQSLRLCLIIFFL